MGGGEVRARRTADRLSWPRQKSMWWSPSATGIAKIVTEANPRVPMVSLSCDSFTSVSNYARPSGNFTGVTCMSTELSPKRLEVAKQMFPRCPAVRVSV